MIVNQHENSSRILEDKMVTNIIKHVYGISWNVHIFFFTAAILSSYTL